MKTGASINRLAPKTWLKGESSNISFTFETYQLQGTPSTILIDQQGILRDISFGVADHLETIIRNLIKSPQT